MNIVYKINEPVKADDAIRVYESSELARPIDQKERIQKMLDNANLVVTAWDNEKLVGIGRAITDFCYCCYLSDLAVDKHYQKQGIGKNIIAKIQEVIGEETSFLLLAAPKAMEYYPKLGFEKVENGYIIRRKR